MSEAVFGLFGPDSSKPQDPFIDGQFRFQFLVIPARRAPRTELGLQHSNLNDALFNDLFDAVSEWHELKKNPLWLVVLLRSQGDSMASRPAVVMAELVNDEANGDRRCREILEQWSRGTSFAHDGTATPKALKDAVNRAGAVIGPLDLTLTDQAPERRRTPTSASRGRFWTTLIDPLTFQSTDRLRLGAAIIWGLLIGFLAGLHRGPLLAIASGVGFAAAFFAIAKFFDWFQRRWATAR